MRNAIALIGLTCASLAWADSPPAPPPAQHQPPSPEEMFKKFDTNHDGVLSLDEFKAGHENMRAMQEERMKEHAEMRGQHMEDRFKQLDKNGDGVLTKDEVKGMPIADRFDKLDTNHDGKLTPDELKAGMSMPPMPKMHDKHHMGDGAAAGSGPT